MFDHIMLHRVDQAVQFKAVSDANNCKHEPLHRKRGLRLSAFFIDYGFCNSFESNVDSREHLAPLCSYTCCMKVKMCNWNNGNNDEWGVHQGSKIFFKVACILIFAIPCCKIPLLAS